MTQEEKDRMAGLLKQVDLQQQEVAMHKLELKVLRDQISKLLGERKALLGEDLSMLPSELEGTLTLSALDRTRSDPVMATGH